MRSQSKALQLVGLLAFVVGLVGYTVFGWRFDSTGDPIITAVAVVCVVVAIVVTIRRSLQSQ
ncbi:hypothetical protein ACFFQF_05185 [Haladaptatus pallidirubidus]|uniref:Uncharacterized protein n=1 Tax=Haladaptatus pallidirubidus TaxID=1008152 RepID=A0AAV3ULC1_9EURY|nr:hypothetical protein [Haladaptatus pallidirubidus]